MHEQTAIWKSLGRGTWGLWKVSFRRLARSRQSWICLLLLGFAGLVVVAWGRHPDRVLVQFVEQILMGVYVSFLLPIYCLCYGAAGISADREEETLVYVLLSPLPRSTIYLAKLSAALAISLIWAFGSHSVLCFLAGPAGRSAWWPAAGPILLGTLAYTSLFHLLGVVWRRAALVGLAYTFFFEVLMSNVPGIAQRMTISHYVRHLLRYLPEMEVTGKEAQAALATLSLEGARSILGLIVLALILFGTVLFTRREY